MSTQQKRRLLRSEKEEIVRQYFEDQMTQSRIAKSWERSLGTIQRICSREIAKRGEGIQNGNE